MPQLIAGVSPATSTGGTSAERRVRLCVVVTVDLTLLNLCRGRFEYLTGRGFEITAVCGPTALANELHSRGVRLFTAPLTRAISPWRDLRAVWRLWRFMRREAFDLVEVSTPKGALVGSIAARLAGATCVVHLLRGLVYEEQRGLMRRLLRLAQAIPCRLAHAVISISPSMSEQATADGLCAADRIRVLGHGSSNGVDLRRFSPPNVDQRTRARRAIALPSDAVVAGFVGRMTGDKGLVELVDAFVEVSASRPDVHLVLVGDYEARDRPAPATIRTVAEHPRIRHVSWQQDPVPFYQAMDFLVLPTYREGFGTVLLEAAAMQLATISTNVVGCRDAVAPDETGLVVPARDAAALAKAMDKLAADPTLRERLGMNGRRRVERFFDQTIVWSLQEEAFRGLLAEHRTARRRAATAAPENPGT